MNKIAFTKIALLSLSSLMIAPTTFAEQPQYTGGMKYTSMRPAEEADAEKKTIYNRKTAEEAAEEEKAEIPEDALPKIEKAPAKPAPDSVWDRYKELAAGKETGKGDENKPQKPEKPEAPQQAQKQADASEQSATGLTGIIQDYKRNKEKRGQMKTIRFAQPEEQKTTISKPEVEKPEVEKPSVQKEEN